jgi:hypothetical protein
MPAPENDILETVLVHCWESALRRQEIDVHDNFYAVGGHSLAAMRIAHKLRNIFSVQVDYLLVLESLTVSALARSLRATTASDLDSAGRAYLVTHGLTAGESA